MKRRSVIIVPLILLGTLSGCFNITGYVDLQLQSVNYRDLDFSQKGPALGVFVEFRRDGTQLRSVTTQARETVPRVPKTTGLFS